MQSSAEARTRVLETERVKENEKKGKSGRICWRCDMNDEYSPMKGYFVYQGIAYGIGTRVRLKEHMHCPTYAHIVKNDIYVFYNSTQNGLYMFHWDDSVERPKHIKGLQKNIYNCDLDIAEIIEPVYPQWISWQQKTIQDMSNKSVCADVFGGVLIYIVIMCIGAIFKDRWTIWLIGTTIFGLWLLNRYRT